MSSSTSTFKSYSPINPKASKVGLHQPNLPPPPTPAKRRFALKKNAKGRIVQAGARGEEDALGSFAQDASKAHFRTQAPQKELQLL